MKIGSIIGEPLKIHHLMTGKPLEKRVSELSELVGLDSFHLKKYPHEFSGGQQQRIVIARAIALNPKFIVCDEAVSALDVSIQSQIINLLLELQQRLHLTYMFISHDLAVIRHISTRIGVMYLGQLVEIADVDELFANPLHPYTEALLSAIPIVDPKERKKRILLPGNVPSPVDIPSGCRFHSRCPKRKETCKDGEPTLKNTGSKHYVRCFLC
jgi:oligopeptide transport system ATP-binding protein